MSSTMTMTTTATAAQLLGDPLRTRTVAAMVRRRVPSCDADDVTQTVLCDALAAPRLPEEPTELRRFLCVLARNKIADFHRRGRRPSADGDACEELPVSPPPVEARSLLARVVDGTSERDRETLEWLVREHEGEELKEIAAEVGLPAPTVRKRVSRLRRALRARWAHALVLLLATGAVAATARHATSRGEVVSITADPAIDTAAGVVVAAQGRWRVSDDYALKHSKRGKIDTSGIEVRIDGRIIAVEGPLASVPGARLSWTIASAKVVAAKTYELELRDDHGRIEHATVVLEGQSSMKVTFTDGAVRGTARLVR
ncbi:MAG: sigma-70 family RNA polymerase sigma factor [Deltaproteobacteria bacterium]|nr:sigma-70 family RNA polymerase sigma factor [Deltaproteobacteria bacterium]